MTLSINGAEGKTLDKIPFSFTFHFAEFETANAKNSTETIFNVGRDLSQCFYIDVRGGEAA